VNHTRDCAATDYDSDLLLSSVGMVH